VQRKNTKNVADGLGVCDVNGEQKTDQTLVVYLDPASRCLENFVFHPVLCGQQHTLRDANVGGHRLRNAIRRQVAEKAAQYIESLGSRRSGYWSRSGRQTHGDLGVCLKTLRRRVANCGLAYYRDAIVLNKYRRVSGIRLNWRHC